MRWMRTGIFIVGISLCLSSLSSAQPKDIVSEFDHKVFSGKYQLSSGHEGEFSIGPNRTFIFVLPDEERSDIFTGIIKKATMVETYVDHGMDMRLAVLEKRRTGSDVASGKRTDISEKFEQPFEIILQGDLLNATPGPQQIIEGKLVFRGAGSEDADWFRDKSGKFSIEYFTPQEK